MRHLSVPSDQTQVWLGRCRSNGWLAETGVVEVDGAHRGLPLNETAPPEDDVLGGFPHVDMEPKREARNTGENIFLTTSSHSQNPPGQAPTRRKATCLS